MPEEQQPESQQLTKKTQQQLQTNKSEEKSICDCNQFGHKSRNLTHSLNCKLNGEKKSTPIPPKKRTISPIGMQSGNTKDCKNIAIREASKSAKKVIRLAILPNANETKHQQMESREREKKRTQSIKNGKSSKKAKSEIFLNREMKWKLQKNGNDSVTVRAVLS